MPDHQPPRPLTVTLGKSRKGPPSFVSWVHMQVALERHRKQENKVLGEVPGKLGPLLSRARWGHLSHPPGARAHSALVQSPGWPWPVLVGSGSQSPSCPGGLGKSLRRATRAGRAQTITSGTSRHGECGQQVTAAGVGVSMPASVQGAPLQLCVHACCLHECDLWECVCAHTS